MHGKILVCGAETLIHVIFECPDGTLGDVATVYVWRHQLDGDRGIFKELGDVGRKFVVHDVKLWLATGAKDGCKEFLVGLCLRACCTVFDGCCQNGVQSMVAQDKNTVVALAGQVREATSQV